MIKVLRRQQAYLRGNKALPIIAKEATAAVTTNFHLVHGQAYLFLMITSGGSHCNYRSYLTVEETDAYTD